MLWQDLLLMDDAHPSELSGAASSKAKLRGAAWVEHRATNCAGYGNIFLFEIRQQEVMPLVE
jgi:hypothetical protein